MWEFIVGVSFGIYIGTYYDCKPTIENIQIYIDSTFKKNE
jgi:hypothetical protein